MVKAICNGEECYSIKDFASLLNRSTPSLRYLCNHETRVHRRLRYHQEGPHIFIPITEIEEFPWHDGSRPYRYVKRVGEERYDKVYEEE